MRKLSPLTELRKAAPGSLTGYKLEQFFRKHRYPRAFSTILNFERGQYNEPPEQFLVIYAEAIGQPVETVRRALRRMQRMRKQLGLSTPAPKSE
jgi:hypothetical protein